MSNQITLFNQNLSVPTEEIIGNIKESVFEGNVSALQTGIFLKKISKISEDIFKDEVFKQHIRNETLKEFNGKSYEGFGMKITERATKTWYDFSNCQDPYWNALNELSEKIKQLKTEREDYLKTLVVKESASVQMAIANTNTVVTIDSLPVLTWEPSGEEVSIKPPIKMQSTGLVYSELKNKDKEE